MLWVVQKNLFNEREYGQFVGSIEKCGQSWMPVTVIPFSREIHPDPPEGRKVVYGSVTLMNEAIRRGWRPGAFFGDQFTQEALLAQWGAHCLNHDGRIVRFGDIPRLSRRMFIRPVDDLKVFAGAVVEPGEFSDWQRRVLALDGAGTLTEEQPCLIADVKDIHREWRFFVVGGAIVTGSQYVLGGAIVTARVDDGPAWDFATDRVREWMPHDNFAVDVAETNDGFRIVEVNCMNSAGFYDSDKERLIRAIAAHDQVPR